MECKVGDRVRFMDDIGGGIIARFIDKKTIAVRDEDGFEIPVSISNIVVVKSDDFFQRDIDTSVDSEINSEINIEEEKPQILDKNFLVEGGVDEVEGNALSYFLGFVHSEQDENILQVFLINDASYRSFVVLSEYKQGNNAKALFSGFIEPDTKLKLMEMPIDYFRTEMEWGLSFLPFKNVIYQSVLPDTADIHLNPLKFFRQGCFQSNDFFTEDALILHIYSSESE
jgi:hypothetical protein